MIDGPLPYVTPLTMCSSGLHPPGGVFRFLRRLGLVLALQVLR